MVASPPQDGCGRTRSLRRDMVPCPFDKHVPNTCSALPGNVRSPKRPTHKVRMKKIPCPLPEPSPAEIELAKTDADARKRVRNQLLRVRRRDEEIARLTAEIADCVYGDVDAVDAVDAGDHGDVYDDLADNDSDRYVYLHHILYAYMVHTTRIVLTARGLGVYGHVSRCPEYLRGSTLHIMRKK